MNLFPERRSTLPAAVWRRLLPPALAAAVVAVLGVALLNPARDTTTGGPLVGKSAPPFTLESLEGGRVSLASLRGRPVVLNFWASWCVPCRQEAPLFRELSERQAAGAGLAVVGVLFQETREQNALDFLREFALAYPSVRDPQSRTAISYGVGGIPETFFIDRAGVVRYVDRGGLTRERMNRGLQTIGVAGL